MYCCLTRHMFTLVHISGFFLGPTSWQLSGPWLVGGLRSRLWLVRSWSRDWLSGQAVSSSSLGQAGASCRWDHSFLQTRNYFSDCQKYSKYFENIFSKIEQSTRKNDFQKYVVNNPRAAHTNNWTFAAFQALCIWWCFITRNTEAPAELASESVQTGSPTQLEFC